MQITVTATLTEEQAIILATEKGYSPTITQIVDNTTMPFVTEDVVNPQSHYEFIKNVYENMIKEDAAKVYIAYDDKENIGKKMAREAYLKNMVASSISSAVV